MLSRIDVLPLDYRIRPATSADLPALQALIQQAYRGPTAARSWSHEGELPVGERVSIDTLKHVFRRSDTELSVAAIQSRLIGSYLLEQDMPGRCTISLLSVDPELQGHGLGDRLLQHAEALAEDTFSARELRIEVLQSKSKLRAYYNRRGYACTGESRNYLHASRSPNRLVSFAKILLRRVGAASRAHSAFG